MSETSVGESLIESAGYSLGGLAGLRGLEEWFHRHLAEIADPAQLGIVCARLGVIFADIAPPHLPLSERVRLLLSHLVQVQAQRGGQGGLYALGNALLADESTAAAAMERGLQTLLGEQSRIALEPLSFPCICQPLPPPPTWLGRDAELGALDAHLRTGARVVFLRGAPGAGKSTLLGRWLRELLVANPIEVSGSGKRHGPKADTAGAPAAAKGASGRTATASAVWQQAGFDGVFYWSFTQDPDVLSFLHAAADYVCGVKSATASTQPDQEQWQEQWPGEEAACRHHLERLLAGMNRRSATTLLVLDGLERMQKQTLPKLPALSHSAAEEREPVDKLHRSQEGTLLEPHLNSLLLALTLGTARGVGVATLHATIPTLRPWLGSRCVVVDVPPLLPSDGAALLRYSGVARGDESDLQERSIEHSGHSLTLHLLGRYLSAYFQGDGRAVTRSELPATDTGLYRGDLLVLKGQASLRQVLRAHLLALPEPARRLLDLCVLLPGSLGISSLQSLLDYMQGHLHEHLQGQLGGGARSAITPAMPGAMPGVMPGTVLVNWEGSSAASFRAPTPPAVLLPDSTWLQGQTGLVERLAELEQLGLLHIVTTPDGAEAIEIHPLVREPIYREWLMGRGGFWPVLRFESDEARGYLPRGEQAVELLEQLVLLLLGAREPDAAYAVLEQRLGGFLHHVHHMGRARRFLFLVRQLYPAVASTALSNVVWQRRYARLLTWEAEALRVLGQLEAALVTAQRQWPLDSPPLPRRLYQQARILRSLGRLEQAAALATFARQGTGSAFDAILAALELATIYLLSGDPALCQVHLLDAGALLREEGGQPSGGLEALELSGWVQRVWARRALYLGHHEKARTLLEHCRKEAEERHSELDGAQCDVLLAELLRQERSYEAAGQALHHALSAACRSGDVETLIHGGLVQGCLRLDTGYLDGAAAALGPALTLASEHGFSTYRIDLLVWRGAIHLRRSDVDAAERDARDALAYATAPGCGYLWGEADALHLLGTVLIAGRPVPGSPRHAEAVAHLTDELDLRERMSSPAAPEIRWLLRRLRP
jgi:tetratricopeptide (TPR) repeat protein